MDISIFELAGMVLLGYVIGLVFGFWLVRK
jgi:hypothetical protein